MQSKEVYDIIMNDKLNSNNTQYHDIIKFLINYDIDKFTIEYPDTIEKIYSILDTNNKKFNDDSVNIILLTLLQKSDKLYDRLFSYYGFSTYIRFNGFFKFLINTKSLEKIKKQNLYSYCILFILYSDEINEYINIFKDFISIYCNNEEEFIKFIKFIKTHNSFSFKSLFYFHTSSIPIEKFIKEIPQDISIINIFIKILENDIQYDNYCYISILNKFLEHSEARNELNYKKNCEILVNDKVKNFFYETDCYFIFTLNLVNYLLKSNIYLSNKELYKILNIQNMECNNEKNIIFTFHYPDSIPLNYKEGINLIRLELAENTNTNTFIKKIQILIEQIILKYLENKVIKLDNELLFLLLENNYVYDDIKLYDNILIKLISNNPKLITPEVVNKVIEETNYYLLLYVIENKYILSKNDINNILEKSICIEDLYDIIFDQYIEKTKENFSVWFAHHHDYYEHIPRFNLEIDDSYLDAIFNFNYNLDFLLKDDFTKIIKTYTKIKLKTFEFYTNLMKQKKSYKLDNDKFKKLLAKNKNIKVDNLCIYCLLYGNYDDLVDEILGEKMINDLEPEIMVILSNKRSARAKYVKMIINS